MIPIFKKLEKEGKLKQAGRLLDLGSGNGKVSLPFFEYGYDVTLVDKDKKVLAVAENDFSKVRESGFKTENIEIEKFDFQDSYDGIIISNVLPFQKNKENVEKVLKQAFAALNEGGFLYFTIFGLRDQWATEHAGTMTFLAKDEALNILEAIPYFTSEDYGQGSTMKGDIKTWHIFHLLYIK